jgi:hypothetical protein
MNYIYCLNVFSYRESVLKKNLFNENIQASALAICNNGATC